MTPAAHRMTRRSSPPSRGQADRVGPAVHRRNGVPPSIQARTDRHRACRGLHRGALVAEAIMRCAQATVYDNSGSKGPRIVAAMTDGFVVGSPTGRTGHRRRIPRVAPMPGIAGHPTPQLAPGKVPMTTRIPRSAKRTAVTAPIPEAVREITRRVFGDSWTSVIRGGGGAA